MPRSYFAFKIEKRQKPCLRKEKLLGSLFPELYFSFDSLARRGVFFPGCLCPFKSQQSPLMGARKPRRDPCWPYRAAAALWMLRTRHIGDPGDAACPLGTSHPAGQCTISAGRACCGAGEGPVRSRRVGLGGDRL